LRGCPIATQVGLFWGDRAEHMFPGVLILASPISVALLIWWWRFRRTGERGKSLQIFLLGYIILIILNGITMLMEQWSRNTPEVKDYILFVIIATVSSYFIGFMGWMALPHTQEALAAVDRQRRATRITMGKRSSRRSRSSERRMRRGGIRIHARN
jgi:hypothetical protein